MKIDWTFIGETFGFGSAIANHIALLIFLWSGLTDLAVLSFFNVMASFSFGAICFEINLNRR